jgi:hypothetical protein
VREPKPDPVLGIGEVDRDNSRLLDLEGDSCEGGEAVRGGVGVEEPDVSDLTLPTLVSDKEASLAPSIIPSADLVSSGELLAGDPNCDKISIQRAVLDFRLISGYLQSSTCPPVPGVTVKIATAFRRVDPLALVIEWK